MYFDQSDPTASFLLSACRYTIGEMVKLEYQIERRLYRVNKNGVIVVSIPAFMGFRAGEIVTLEFDSKNEDMIKIRRND